MFTVKLLRASPRETKLVEAEEVFVNEIRKNELIQICADDKSFVIANPAKITCIDDLLPGDPKPKELWSEAYVENSSGATTDRVRFTV